MKNLLLFLFFVSLIAPSKYAFAKKEGDLGFNQPFGNIRVTPGALPQNNNNKQDFLVQWDVASAFSTTQFQKITVDVTIVRADNSSKSDTVQVNGTSREATVKIKGNSAPVTATVTITGTGTRAFTCTEKFSGTNLSVNEPPATLNLGLVDFTSITPLANEDQKKKQTFDVKWTLVGAQNPNAISKFKIDLIVLMDNQTKENDQKSPNPAAGVATMKIKSPGSPVQAQITATGELPVTASTKATLGLVNPPSIKDKVKEQIKQ